MRIKESFRCDFPPPQARESLFDEEANRYVIQHHPEIVDLKVLEKKESGKKIHAKLDYTMEVPMPGPVRKVLGSERNGFVVEMTLNTDDDRGTMSVLPKVLPDKIKVQGQIYFEEKGDHWLQYLEGDLNVGIFGVGKLIEKFIRDKFRTSFGEEVRLRNEFLRNKAKS